MPLNGRRLAGDSVPQDLSWIRTQIVLVTGDFPNTCGHILLYVGGGFGHYFHFDGPTPLSYPLYLRGDSEYRAYLRGTGKSELMRKRIVIPHPSGAEARLFALLKNKWLTGLVSHNCGTFAMEVIKAGGNFWSFPEECPVLGMSAVMLVERLFGVDAQMLRAERR